MKNIKYLKILVLIVVILNLNLSKSFAEKDFFEEAKKKFEEKKLDESKFLFQRNIVFNPKHAKSYIYLAKIFNAEKNDQEKEKNLNTALSLDPTNEDAMFMLIDAELDKSNYSVVKDLKDSFQQICVKLCDKKKYIEDSLKDIEPKNES